MTTSEAPAPSPRPPERFLSRATLIVLGLGGPVLPRLSPAPPWEATAPTSLRLTLRHLVQMLKLASGASVDELAPSEQDAGRPMDDLVETLRSFGLLTAIDPTPATSTPPATPATTPADGPRQASTAPTAQRVLRLPISLRPGPAGYEAIDHDGAHRITLTPVELIASRSFEAPSDREDAYGDQAKRLGPLALNPRAHARLVDRLAEASLLVTPDTTRASRSSLRDLITGGERLVQSAAALNRAHDVIEGERAERTGTTRIPVYAVQVAGNVPPLSTGMILSHAISQPDLHDVYDLHPRWVLSEPEVDLAADQAALLLFTDYLWSHEQNLEFSAAVKARCPKVVTIHGGPDCPTYPGDTEEYLERNRHIDIVVRGEGEITASEVFRALGPSLKDGKVDLSALRQVPGLVYRDGDQIIRTEEHPRMTDVDVVPSPYLTGVFQAFGDTRSSVMAIIETNRGCPYSCAFCDWGSATNSRIRKFDLDRVMAEFDWCAQHEVPSIFIADANFGIFDRDVEIARHVAQLKQTYGYPKRFITNYAKNTVKHLKQIVSILAEAEILSEGLLSLQTLDEETLRTIRRSNIKIEKYDALAAEFRQSSMPLFVDLMMGLPGQTPASLLADLQQCVDREVTAKCHATELLVNSPMNDPAYRAEHAVVASRQPGATGEGVESAKRAGPALVVSTSSFTREELHEMHLMRRTYLLCENLGVLRHVARYVRSVNGTKETDLYERMRRDAALDPERWPYLAMTLDGTPDSMVPPVSWSLFIDDLRRYLESVAGIASGSPLETVLTVQRAVLPSPHRSFPERIDLQHDYVSWYHQVLSLKEDGHRFDWETVTTPLADFGPGVLTVDDPWSVGQQNMGRGSAIVTYNDWELETPISKAMPHHHQLG